ncbi:unnamed protein product [Urochloa humidicola]
MANAAGDHDDHSHGHFLVVAYGLQGHLNPARALARRLACVHGAAARVTLSVTVSAHGRMFPSLASPDEEVSDGLISYVPYSDGFEFGATPRDADQLARSTRESARSLSAIVRRFAATGQPVTSIVSAFSLIAAEVAVEHGIPLAIYWIQAATAFAVYYHYFHGGYERLVASHVADPMYEVSIPGLRPLWIHEFPTFLVDTSGREKGSVQWLRSLFEYIDREKPKILVNTLNLLEAAALKELKQKLDVFAVGPMLPHHLKQVDETEDRIIHLYKQDQKGYMEWLEAKPTRSVVYMSYGSMFSYNTQQVQEILQGLRECGRPYLWVVRKDERDEEVEHYLMDDGSSEQGMILEWCDQLEVLSHPSVGCFITHCGWNSTLEAITLGVPMITVPNWSDQPLNAHLVEELGVGVRAECNDAGLLVGTELAKCIKKVVGAKAKSMYERAKALKDKIRKEVIEGGLVELELQSFITAMQNPK